VVAARDEEANIGACVGAIAASRYAGPLRVRVVDDGSTDRTAAIAGAIADRDPRGEVVAAGALPDGWLGKNHALHVGTRGASEPWLLFVDADLRVGEGAIARAVAAATRRGADLFTMMPRVEARSFWERAVMPLVTQLIDAWLPAREINQPERREAAAIGPFMLFRREAYRRIGGHEAVRAEVVEDLRLAEAVKRAGLRLVYARGIALASVRMYDSLAAIVRGWSKNFHVALGRAAWLAPVAAAGLVLFFAGPFVVPLVAALAGARAAALVGGAAALVAVLARIDFSRRYGVTLRGAWATPLGALVIAWILVRSSLRRPVSWKGRPVR
jgi:glycosyltransferase involved in cell wall biosynthesis